MPPEALRCVFHLCAVLVLKTNDNRSLPTPKPTSNPSANLPAPSLTTLSLPNHPPTAVPSLKTAVPNPSVYLAPNLPLTTLTPLVQPHSPQPQSAPPVRISTDKKSTPKLSAARATSPAPTWPKAATRAAQQPQSRVWTSVLARALHIRSAAVLAPAEAATRASTTRARLPRM